MAVNKNAIVNVFGGGRIAAQSLVPPLTGLHTARSLSISVEGKTYDVLSFNPVAARELLANAGFPGGIDSKGHRLTVDLLAPSGAEVQDSLRDSATTMAIESFRLGESCQPGVQRVAAKYLQPELSRHNLIRGLGILSRSPNWFLNQFVTGSSVNVDRLGRFTVRFNARLSECDARTHHAHEKVGGVRANICSGRCHCSRFTTRCGPIRKSHTSRELAPT